MNLADLRIFKAVVDEGGVTRAAVKVKRVQSNLSARIRHLEQDLGHQLFERSGRRMLLTPEGRRLYDSAAKLLLLAEEVRAGLCDTPAAGLLRIGAMESTAATRLPEILARFHRQHPETHIELSTGTARALLDRLMAGEIDLALCAGNCGDAALSATPAFRETLVLVLPLGSDARYDLARSCMIAFPSGCAYRGIVGTWLRSRDIAPRQVIELASYHAMLACVAGGMGFAAVPQSLLGIYPQKHLLATRALPQSVARQTTWLVSRRHSASPSASAFRAALA